MGRSGSLDHVQVNSPAARHVFAKAGHVAGNSLGTALAGYIEPPGGEPIAFSQYLEKLQDPSDDMNQFWELGTEAQGEIVTAVWEHVVAPTRKVTRAARNARPASLTGPHTSLDDARVRFDERAQVFLNIVAEVVAGSG